VLSGVWEGVCGVGVSDAGGVVDCGVSCAAGVCAAAAPVRQSAISAGLLKRRKRLLWIDITYPLHFPMQ
jgi:hypothetical protein